MHHADIGWLITHSFKKSVSGFISHRDDLVVVDPQQVSDNYILPLLCAETEAEHGQSHDTHDDIYQVGSQQTCKNISCTLERLRSDCKGG